MIRPSTHNSVPTGGAAAEAELSLQHTSLVRGRIRFGLDGSLHHQNQFRCPSSQTGYLEHCRLSVCPSRLFSQHAPGDLKGVKAVHGDVLL